LIIDYQYFARDIGSISLPVGLTQAQRRLKTGRLRINKEFVKNLLVVKKGKGSRNTPLFNP